MTPAEQIKIETSTLEEQIEDLVLAYETRTGVAVQKIGPATFGGFSHYRKPGEPFGIYLFVELPLPEAKQV